MSQISFNRTHNYWPDDSAGDSLTGIKNSLNEEQKKLLKEFLPLIFDYCDAKIEAVMFDKKGYPETGTECRNIAKEYAAEIRSKLNNI